MYKLGTVDNVEPRRRGEGACEEAGRRGGGTGERMRRVMMDAMRNAHPQTALTVPTPTRSVRYVIGDYSVRRSINGTIAANNFPVRNATHRNLRALRFTIRNSAQSYSILYRPLTAPSLEKRTLLLW